MGRLEPWQRLWAPFILAASAGIFAALSFVAPAEAVRFSAGLLVPLVAVGWLAGARWAIGGWALHVTISGLTTAFGVQPTPELHWESSYLLGWALLLASGVLAGILGPAYRRLASHRDALSQERTSLLHERHIRHEITRHLQFQARLLEAVSEAVVATDVDGRITYWNSTAQRLFGWGADDVAGKQAFGLLAPRLPAEDLAIIQRAVDTQGGWLGELAMTSRDGRTRPMHVHITPVMHDDGRMAGRIAVLVDLTQRKQTESQLQESRRRYRLLAENSSDIVTRHAPDGRVLYVSPAATHILGHSMEDLALFGDMLGLVHLDDVASSRAAFSDALKAPWRPALYTVRLRHKDGRYLWFETMLTPVTDGEGQAVVELVAAARDITERKRAEDALRESDWRLRMLARATNDTLWDYDIGSGHIWWSPNYLALFGPLDIDDGDIEGWRMRIHDDDRQRVVDALQAAMASDAETWEEEYRLRRADGSHALVLDRGFISRDADGAPRRMVGSLMDITERRRDKEAVERLAARLESLIDNVPGIVWEAALPDGFGGSAITTYASANVEEVLGYAKERWLHEPDFVESIVHPDDLMRLSTHFLALEPCDVPVQVRVRLRHADGHHLDMLASCAVTRVADNKAMAICTVLTDITEMTRLEEESAKQREVATRNERLTALGTLVAGVAHEINNPLTYISGHLELALMDIDTLASAGVTLPGIELAETRSGLQDALSGAQRIERITRALKTVARQSSAGRAEHVEVGELLRSIESLVRIGAPDHCELTCRLPAEPTFVHGNASELHQVMLNLTRNAIDAVQQERVGVIELSASTEDGRVVIDVHDNGPGIPPDLLARLFTPFFTTKASGTGLGLCIAHSIVTSHGGDITVRSSAGEGTCFSLRLPLVKAPAALLG